jgi:hypothetical protein
METHLKINTQSSAMMDILSIELFDQWTDIHDFSLALISGDG